MVGRAGHGARWNAGSAEPGRRKVAAFSPSLAWVSGAGPKYASAFSAVPEGRLYPKLRHFLATVHVIAGEAARSSPRTVIRR